jgi:hypothetical protein
MTKYLSLLNAAEGLNKMRTEEYQLHLNKGRSLVILAKDVLLKSWGRGRNPDENVLSE